MNVSRCILGVDTSIFVTSNSEQKEYQTMSSSKYYYEESDVVEDKRRACQEELRFRNVLAKS